MSTPIYFSLIVCECGDPAGIIPRAGTGTVRKCSPRHLTGAGAGKISPRGGGDGGPSPDGDFPVAIPNRGEAPLESSPAIADIPSQDLQSPLDSPLVTKSLPSIFQ
jgi:hypothetical protein